MTTIAFDGRYVAADTLVTMGNTIVPGNPIRKIFPVEIANGTKKPNRLIYCFCGSLALFPAAVHWHAAGADPSRQPLPLDEGISFVVIDARNINRPRVYEYTGMGHGHGLCLNAPVTFGSGNEIAQTVLNLGHDAMVAVEHAAVMDIYSSLPIEAFDVKKWVWVKRARPAPANSDDLRAAFKGGLKKAVAANNIPKPQHEKDASRTVEGTVKA